VEWRHGVCARPALVGTANGTGFGVLADGLVFARGLSRFDKLWSLFLPVRRTHVQFRSVRRRGLRVRRACLLGALGGVAMSAFPVGSRVRLVHDVERYPHFIARAGSVGTVVDIGDPQIFAVRLDEFLPGAEGWGNEVHWQNYADDPSEDLEEVSL
jgi:hypothetical protein